MDAKIEVKKSSNLIYSLILHSAILIFLVITIEFPSRTIVAEKGDSETEIIQAAVVSPQTIKAPPVTTKNPLPPPPPKKVIPPQPQPQPVQNPIAIQQQLLADLNKEKKRQKQLKHQQQKKLANDFSKKIKQLATKSLQEQLQQEQSRVSALQARKLKGIVDHYRALILQAISQNWRVPGAPDKNLSADLLIHLAPGGTVLDVQVAKSSGNDSLDRSAETAVFRSSPLPVPSDPDDFEPFRQFVLRVKPENIQAAG
ncbi:MAG: energy transducer TonB [Gammaproteobacteria bacterium]|nr:energy transducer TonB [Gammaproteobacteria bacterium]